MVYWDSIYIQDGILGLPVYLGWYIGTHCISRMVYWDSLYIQDGILGLPVYLGWHIGIPCISRKELVSKNVFMR